MKKIIVKKPSAMIQNKSRGLTANQRKMINSLVHLAQREGLKEIYTTTIVQLKNLCNIQSTENQELKKRIKELVDFTIEFNYLDKDKQENWTAMSLLSEVTIKQDSGVILFAFPPTLNKNIIQPSVYTLLDVIMLANLTNSYSIVLYELLKDYLNSPALPKISIEQLRDLLGIEKSKYRQFKYLKRDVIDIAVKEINEKTDIKCEYWLIKEHGNRYSAIQFKAVKNKTLVFDEGDNQLKISFKTENLNEKVSPVVPEEPSKAEVKARELDPIHVEISEKLKMKPELVSSLADKHGLDKVKRVMAFTLAEPRKNVSGFFIKALENDYVIPMPGEMAVKSGDDALQKERISVLRYEANKCYTIQGGPGDCGIHDRTNPGSPCCYCKKWNRETKTAVM